MSAFDLNAGQYLCYMGDLVDWNPDFVHINF